MNDIYVHANCPWAVAYNALFCAVPEPNIPCPYRAAVLCCTQPRATALRAFALGCYAAGFQPADIRPH